MHANGIQMYDSKYLFLYKIEVCDGESSSLLGKWSKIVIWLMAYDWWIEDVALIKCTLVEVARVYFLGKYHLGKNKLKYW